MWELLVKINPNLIRSYNGNKERVFEIALKNGFEPSKEDLNKDNFCSSSSIISYLIKKDYNLIKYYKKDLIFYDSSLIKEAMDMGYKPTMEDLINNNSLGYSEDVISFVIAEGYPDAIKYFISKGWGFSDDSIYDIALEKGYVPTKEDIINNVTLCKSLKILEIIIPIYPESIKYISGSHSREKVGELIDLAIEKGYKPSEEDLEQNYRLSFWDKLFYLVLDEHPEYIKHYKWNNQELFKIALEKGYKPTIDDYKKYYGLRKSDIITELLIEKDPNICALYTGENEEIIKKAIEKGYKPTIKDCNHNMDLLYSDTVTLFLLDQDKKIIEEYKGTNPLVFRKAFQLGYDPINNSSFFEEPYIVCEIIDFYPDYINKYNYKELSKDNKMKPLARAVKNGYEIPLEEIKNDYNINQNVELMLEIVKRHPEYIIYYKGDDERVYRVAVDKGFSFTKELLIKELYVSTNPKVMFEIVKVNPELIDVFSSSRSDDCEYFYLNLIKLGIYPSETLVEKNYSLNHNYNIMKELIKINPNYIKYYAGSEHVIELYKEAFNLGFKPDLNNFISEVNELARSNFDLMFYLVKMDYRYIEVLTSGMQIAINVLLKDYIPSYDEVKNNYYITKNDEIMLKLLEKDFNYIKYYRGNNVHIFEKAFEFGYELSIEDFKNCYEFLTNDEITMLFISKLPDIIEYYRGDNVEVYKYALEKGYTIKEINKDSSYITINKEIIMLLSKKDYSILKDMTINDSYNLRDLYIFAINDGYQVSIEEIIRNDLYHLLSEELIYEIIDRSNSSECINLLFDVVNVKENVKKYICKNKNIIIPEEYEELLKVYSLDRYKFLNNISNFETFLLNVNIDKNTFIQYAFGNNYDWLNDMLNILDNNEIDDFIYVKDYFFNNYYTENNNEVICIENFINILMNYSRYKELCLDIARVDKLDKSYKEKIDFIFYRNDTFDKDKKPKKFSDLNNIEMLFKDKYITSLNDVEDKDINEIKDIICNLLFNKDYTDASNLLKIYGDSKNLRQLMFLNKDDDGLSLYISEMMIFASMIEGVIFEDDKEYLIEMAYNILNNFELSSYCSILFSNYEKKMRELYEIELNKNMTNIKNVKEPSILLNKELTQEYGVEVYDFSNKDYCLLAHVKSGTETCEELVEGKAINNKNFICLSAISYRNQVYYAYNDTDIVFGYDYVPSGNFRMSSTSNMGSNSSLKSNDTNLIGDISFREQRGILEVSQAPSGYNSEILTFREGLKPKYIILPGDRVPTEEEIEIAKKYGLKFVKTQKVKEEIKNPEHIEFEDIHSISKYDDKLAKLKKIKEKLKISNRSNSRQIAIFTDSHGLFEPTLAILEDARKNGITEIYSLGDNIGTGPNPKEVLELLEEYGVKSIKGNHEGYVFDGVYEYKEHLMETGGFDEALKNSDWTRSKLSDEDLEKISKYPDEFVIEIGGEKVLLTHYLEDVKTGKVKDVPKDIKMVFEGHKHFESETDQKSTLRGAGIGISSDIDNHSAYYIVLTEKDDGGFEVEKRRVNFDYMHTYHDISLSDMNEHDKEKIEGWAGLGK